MLNCNHPIILYHKSYKKHNTKKENAILTRQLSITVDNVINICLEWLIVMKLYKILVVVSALLFANLLIQIYQEQMLIPNNRIHSNLKKINNNNSNNNNKILNISIKCPNINHLQFLFRQLTWCLVYISQISKIYNNNNKVSNNNNLKKKNNNNLSPRILQWINLWSLMIYYLYL